MIRDQAPRISIRSPKSYTVIDYGLPLKMPLFMTVSDDYGVTGVTLVTTISSGNGEAVKFSEQETPFPPTTLLICLSTTWEKRWISQRWACIRAMNFISMRKATDTHRAGSKI
jgi:hypothetical protein